MLRPSLTALLLASTTLLTSACIEGYPPDVDDAPTDDDGPEESECKVVEVANNGTVTFTSDADIAKYKGAPKSGCWELHGTLELKGVGITSLAGLGQLRKVDNLLVDGTALTAFDVDGTLTSLGITLLRNNKKLVAIANLEIQKDALLEPGITITVEGNSLIESLGSLESTTLLEPVTGGPDTVISIKQNPKLATVRLADLTDAGSGSFNLSGNDALTTIDLGGLSGTLHDVYLADNPRLTTVTLSHVDTYGNVTIKNDGSLATLAGFAGVTDVMGQLTVDSNAQLSSLAPFNKAAHIYSFVSFRLNPELSTCQIAELDACVPSGAVTNAGNKAGTSCPKPWCQQ